MYRKRLVDTKVCPRCGSDLIVSLGPNRFRTYKDQDYEIPSSLKFSVCPSCKIEYLTPYQEKILTEYFEKQRAHRYFCLTSSGRIFQARDWWLFLSCEHDLIDYYRWQCQRYGLDVVKASKSGPHCSISRGERPRNHAEWKYCMGQALDFKYSNQVRWNDEHVWLDVEPRAINMIRNKVGLPIFSSYHITIGKFRHKA